MVQIGKTMRGVKIMLSADERDQLLTTGSFRAGHKGHSYLILCPIDTEIAGTITEEEHGKIVGHYEQQLNTTKDKLKKLIQKYKDLKKEFRESEESSIATEDHEIEMNELRAKHEQEVVYLEQEQLEQVNKLQDEIDSLKERVAELEEEIE